VTDRGHRVFAWGYGKLGPRLDRRGTSDRRRELLSRAAGRTVEVGAGTGLNFRYYPSAVSEVLAVEPDRWMFRYLVAALPNASVPVRLKRAPAEALPVDDGSVQTVVMSLVLCSVVDPDAALAEASRVLEPGGTLLFFEHVRAVGTRLARAQDRFERPWGWVAGGCHPNRDTMGAIAAAGFEVQDVVRFDEPGAMLATPHVLGRAFKP
jgi:ubiquinone/menaquinone biosynthesis C-methylase UbiE